MAIISNDLQKAVSLLCEGEVIAIPTETVYGLAADPDHLDAVKKIFSIKKRLPHQALPVLLHDPTQIKYWANEIPENAKKLAARFWPGALTMVFKKSSHVSEIISGGENTIGLRVPNHDLTLALLKQFSKGLVVTSANISGQENAISALQVKEIFGDSLKFILDGGICKIQQASTAIDLTQTPLKILRLGIISEKEILDCLNNKNGVA